MADNNSDPIQSFRDEISKVVVEQNESGNDQLREVLYRMIKFYMTNKDFSVSQAVELFAAALEKATSAISKDAYTAIIGDTFWFFGIDSAKSPEKLARIGTLLKALVEKDVASGKVLKQTTEGSILEHAGLIPSKKALDDITVRINTIDNFDQKYSFSFKDDPEGYARLLAYLSFLERSQSVTSDCTSIVFSLIGKYDLCPQKVLYRMFESYDACSAARKPSPAYRNAIFKIATDLIPNKRPIVVETVTDALRYYATLGNSYCPHILIDYMAKLITDGSIVLDDVWPHLTPSENEIQRSFEKLLKTDSSFDESQSPICTKVETKVNTKFMLINSLIRFENLSALGTSLGRCALLFPCANPEIARGLCGIVERRIAPYYANYLLIPNPSVAAIPIEREAFAAFREQVIEPLKYFGCYLCYANSALYSKVCRVLEGFLKVGDLDEASKEAIYEFTQNVLLQSCVVVKTNVAVSCDLWRVLSHIPTDRRFVMYNNFYDMVDGTPDLVRIRQRSQKLVDTFSKKITSENYKEYAKYFVKLFHNTSLFTIGRFIEKYKNFMRNPTSTMNFVPKLVAYLKYMSPLSCDVIIYSICKEIYSSPSEKDKRAISMLCGLIYKKNKNIDLYPLLRCLSGDKIDISFKSAILREVIEGMSGYKNDSNNRRTNPDINIEAADKYVLAGNIYYKTKKIDSEKLSKSIVQKLLGHFKKDNTISNFIVDNLISSENSLVKERVFNMRETMEQYDSTMDTVLYIIRFLERFLNMGKLLPPIEDMVRSKKLSLPMIFTLYRSILDEYLATNQDKFIALLKETYPDNVIIQSHPLFYISFWRYSLSDIYLPEAFYNDIIKKLHASGDESQADEDNGDDDEKKSYRIKKRIHELTEDTEAEFRKKKEAYNLARQRILQEKDRWLEDLRTEDMSPDKMYGSFVQDMILPRCRISTQDAFYCNEFFFLLHHLSAKNFLSGVYFNSVTKYVPASVAGCTEHESCHVGVFLNNMYRTINLWKDDKNAFETEFSKSKASSKTKTSFNPIEKNDYDKKGHLIWHQNMAKHFQSILKKRDPVQVHNVMMVMKAMAKTFPMYSDHRDMLIGEMDEIMEGKGVSETDINIITILKGEMRAKKLPPSVDKPAASAQKRPAQASRGAPPQAPRPAQKQATSTPNSDKPQPQPKQPQQKQSPLTSSSSSSSSLVTSSSSSSSVSSGRGTNGAVEVARPTTSSSSSSTSSSNHRRESSQSQANTTGQKQTANPPPPSSSSSGTTMSVTASLFSSSSSSSSSSISSSTSSASTGNSRSSGSRSDAKKASASSPTSNVNNAGHSSNVSTQQQQQQHSNSADRRNSSSHSSSSSSSSSSNSQHPQHQSSSHKGSASASNQQQQQQQPQQQQQNSKRDSKEQSSSKPPEKKQRLESPRREHGNRSEESRHHDSGYKDGSRRHH